MKRISIIALSFTAICLLFFPATAQESESGKAATEHVIKKLEGDWAVALVERDEAALDRIVSPDWVLTDPMGGLMTRAQAEADLKTGILKFELIKFDELKVRVYGDAAIVYGLDTENSQYKGRDMSGQYRFTDVFVKRDGRWQAVSTQVTRVVKE